MLRVERLSEIIDGNEKGSKDKAVNILDKGFGGLLAAVKKPTMR